MWRFKKSIGGKDGAAERSITRPSRKQKTLIWIERILLVSGLALVGFYGAASMESWLTSRAALNHFGADETLAQRNSESDLDNVTSDVDSGSPEEPALPNVDFSLWGEHRVKTYRQSIGKYPDTPLAVLRIPKISLEAPLLDGTDDLTLNHAVGRIAGTARPGEPGNIGIAGHRDGFFRGLKDVRVGDAIELKTLKGTDTYVVDEIQIVSPRQVEVLRPTSVPSLTLVTCYPFYFFGSAPQRYIVTASLSPEKNGGSEDLDLGAPATANNSTISNSTRRKQMNLFKKASFFGKGAGALVLVMAALGTAPAQDSTVTTITHGQPSFDAQVKNAEIVYVEGNDLVLKLENGRAEHLVVPDNDRFTIDGKQVSVHELVPGTKLTQTITTTTTPRYVNSVRTIEGKVWHVNAPKSVILTLPENQNQVFNVPNHAKFIIDGQEKTVFDLRKGMKIKATIVTDQEHTVVESNKVAYGRAPQIATPRMTGVLLFLAPTEPPVTLASAEQPAETLPETGTALPLIGLGGSLVIAMAVALGAARRNFIRG
jgi:sortase A